jgi:hypothetical protein
MIPREVQQCDAQDVEQSWSRRGAALVWTAARLLLFWGPTDQRRTQSHMRQGNSCLSKGRIEDLQGSSFDTFCIIRTRN